MPRRPSSPARSDHEFDLSAALFHNNESDEFDLDVATTKSAEETIERPLDIQDQSSEIDDETIIADQLATSNRKASNLKGRTVKKGGGFQALGLNANLLKAITRKGFSVPTPIQRKTVPLLLQDKDVVGMARTGSGKTAAFVIPMIEKLKTHSTKIGARALILSPSRELALQTLHVVKEMGRGTDLKTVLLVGGDSLEDQFRSMASNPDVMIATPGRFLHLKVEMGLDLSSVRYVVFDEADRLFEMGFAIQLTEILHSLPSARQTMLFSATLPKSLVEFARAGLQDPVLVRLDADSKVSPDLKSAFFTVKSADKEGALLHILEDVIKIPQSIADTAEASAEAGAEVNREVKKSRKRKRGNDAVSNPKQAMSRDSTIVFAATKHHVEYLAHLLRLAGYAVSHVYGSLDQLARRAQIQAFREGKTNILVVTDVAARGIDVPLLANVINYDFPPQPKIFVHRVGRTARAGQTGWSYSIIRDSDAPYLLDLQLFLSKKLVLGRADPESINFAEVVSVGSLQRDKLEQCSEWVGKTLREDTDVLALQTVAAKGEKLYQRTRNAASAESAKRARDITSSEAWMTLHTLFNDESDKMEIEREKMLARVGGFRPQESIFEIGARRTGKNVSDENLDSIKRIRSKLETKKRKAQTLNHSNNFSGSDMSKASPVIEEEGQAVDSIDVATDDEEHSDNLSLASTTSLEVTFSQPTSSIGKPQHKHYSTTDPAHKFRSAFNYMSYTPTSTSLVDSHAYAVNSDTPNSNFVSAVRSVTMDLANDDTTRGYGQTGGIMRWDKRAKKYVRRSNDTDGSRGKQKMVKGEGGTRIAASFRSGRFDAWKKKERMGRLPRVGEVEGKVLPRAQSGLEQRKRYRHTKADQPKRPDKLRGDYEKRLKKAKEAGDRTLAEKGKNEVRGNEEIRKRRKEKERRREKNARPTRKKGRGKV